MMKKTILFSVLAMLLCISAVYAGEDNLPKEGRAKGLLLPQSIARFEEAVRAEVEKSNLVNITNNEITSVMYNEDGDITSVSYKDGGSVDYSYEYDKAGELIALTLTSSNGSKLKVENGQVGGPQANGSKEGGPIQHDASNDKDKDASQPLVLMVKQPLGQLSKTPMKFDFDGIKKSLDKASKDNKNAYNEYLKNTSPYYERILGELKDNRENLKAEGVDLNEPVVEIKSEEVSGKKARNIIDNEVMRIRSENNKNSGERVVAEKFLLVEKEHFEKFIKPSKEIYEGKVKKTQEYINGIIDSLITSKLAVYLNTKNEKIEAIINLPEERE